jgi:hypothetical protein
LASEAQNQKRPAVVTPPGALDCFALVSAVPTADTLNPRLAPEMTMHTNGIRRRLPESRNRSRPANPGDDRDRRVTEAFEGLLAAVRHEEVTRATRLLHTLNGFGFLVEQLAGGVRRVRRPVSGRRTS